jgi:hypothetical protein
MNNTSLDLVFPAVGGREVISRNDGGDITSDAGLLLVSLADKKIGLTQAMADAILDPREQGKISHGIIEMARERIYAICQDYEDANDIAARGHYLLHLRPICDSSIHVYLGSFARYDHLPR